MSANSLNIARFFGEKGLNLVTKERPKLSLNQTSCSDYIDVRF